MCACVCLCCTSTYYQTHALGQVTAISQNVTKKRLFIRTWLQASRLDTGDATEEIQKLSADALLCTVKGWLGEWAEEFEDVSGLAPRQLDLNNKTHARAKIHTQPNKRREDETSSQVRKYNFLWVEHYQQEDKNQSVEVLGFCRSR